MAGEKYVFAISEKAQASVSEQVRQQNAVADKLGLPNYGFPNSKLYDIPEIGNEASKRAARKFQDAGHVSWHLYHSLERGVYCEAQASGA